MHKNVFVDRNRADRDLMYESIEEVAESHDEVPSKNSWLFAKT